MTAKDLELIERARKTPRTRYVEVENMIPQADTDDARWYLWQIRDELFESVRETI